MAYGTTSQFGSNVGIVNVYAPSYEEIVYKNNDLFSLGIFEAEASNGDTAYRWKLHTAGNTSAEIFAESDIAPQAVAQSYLNCAVSYVYFWAWVRISGHARDAARGRGIHPGMDVLDLEMQLSMEDLRDLINTTFMGTSNSGLQVSVDSSTDYAGVTRASYSGFCSTETAHNSTLTLAAILDQLEFSRDNDKGGRTGIILGPHNQLTNYATLVGVPAAANNSLRWNADQGGGGRMDLAPRADMLSVSGVPMVGLGDWTDTVLIGLDTRPGKNLVVTHRPFDVRGPDMAGDDDLFEISTSLVIVNKNPRFDWKLTGVTA